MYMGNKNSPDTAAAVPSQAGRTTEGVCLFHCLSRGKQGKGRKATRYLIIPTVWKTFPSPLPFLYITYLLSTPGILKLNFPCAFTCSLTYPLTYSYLLFNLSLSICYLLSHLHSHLLYHLLSHYHYHLLSHSLSSLLTPYLPPYSLLFPSTFSPFSSLLPPRYLRQ